MHQCVYLQQAVNVHKFRKDFFCVSAVEKKRRKQAQRHDKYLSSFNLKRFCLMMMTTTVPLNTESCLLAIAGDGNFLTFKLHKLISPCDKSNHGCRQASQQLVKSILTR